jgi:hypothetical protein
VYFSAYSHIGCFVGLTVTFKDDDRPSKNYKSVNNQVILQDPFSHNGDEKKLHVQSKEAIVKNIEQAYQFTPEQVKRRQL